jgi:hypothetical protein
MEFLHVDFLRTVFKPSLLGSGSALLDSPFTPDVLSPSLRTSQQHSQLPSRDRSHNLHPKGLTHAFVYKYEVASFRVHSLRLAKCQTFSSSTVLARPGICSSVALLIHQNRISLYPLIANRPLLGVLASREPSRAGGHLPFTVLCRNPEGGCLPLARLFCGL